MINTLLIFKDEALRRTTIKTLQGYYRDQIKIENMPSLQDAIEDLEVNKKKFDLILFEQKSPSMTMAKALFPLGNGAKFIMCEETQNDIAALLNDYVIDRLHLNAIELELPKLLKKFEALGHLPPSVGNAVEYLSVKPEIMASFCPLNYDVFIKMSDGRFVKLFKRGDQVERVDFDRYQKEKGIELFYFNKHDYQGILEESAKRIDKIAEIVPLPEELVAKEAAKSHAVVKDIISSMGFTPEAQMIAKSSVAMIVKLMVAKPKLSKILSDLKRNGGNYVSSHSISLGTLSCAIAHKIEWHSAATYFKLSLAAFIHDITLTDKMAQVNFLKDATKELFTADEILKIKLHPVHAADYVRKMNEIPGDVDQIVFQHHERPDGTGYPRSLNAKFISPLSCVFIMAHEMIEFMRLREGESIDVFLKENEELYHQGNFRKIWLALKADGTAIV